ncbi:MAG: hypothetical protein IBX57_00030 [Gammaproteobacteria bacterium]|nr:hypothetical protein [Gammaproteobacteria bacterium]
MSNYLTRHAIENVWCSHDQDHQHLYQPARISIPKGVRRFVGVEWSNVRLPDYNKTYHVYQIGNISPAIINLIPNNDRWYIASETINKYNMIIDVYDDKGRHLPRFTAYFRKSVSGNLVIAVEDQPRISELRYRKLYVRFYTNAYFSSERSHETEDRVFTKGIKVTGRNQVVVFQNEIQDIKDSWGGEVYVFLNGWWCKGFNPDNVAEGDILEYVHDTSVKKIESFKIDDLETFTSTLDSLRKYLILRDTDLMDTIDYKDDMDIFLVKKEGYLQKGITYHQSTPFSVRMVTHKDYSIPVQHLTDLASEIEDWDNLLDLYIVLQIRRAGYERPLVFEHHRIKELMRLDKDKVLQAMVGSNSNVEEWKAASLENSKYVELMRAKLHQVNEDFVQTAYGYNAITKMFGDNLHKPYNLGGKRVVYLPTLLQDNATIFEFDMQGRLVDFYHHDSGRIYEVKNEITGYVEAITGRGGDSSYTYYGYDWILLNPLVGYKCYITDLAGGNPLKDNWRLAVEGSDYKVEGDVLTWLVDRDTTWSALRTDDGFLVRKFQDSFTDGILRFTIKAMDRVQEETVEVLSHIPPAKLEVFLNGHPLIENLDYFVKWPEVIISNKEYLKPDLDIEQDIVVRCLGFCTDDLQRLPANDFGYVENGILSANNRFDVRDDKVMRFVAGGRIYHQNELQFCEDDCGIRIGNIGNGTPYLIDETPVALGNLINEEVHSFRERSLNLDKRISDYLTMYYPEPERSEISVIDKRYRIISPFISKIYYDLASGFFYPEGIENQYSEEKAREWVKDYEWLLDYDPINHGVDQRYVSIHPHPLFTEVSLDIYRYNFLLKIVKSYYNDRMNIASHINIKEGWV